MEISVGSATKPVYSSELAVALRESSAAFPYGQLIPPGNGLLTVSETSKQFEIVPSSPLPMTVNNGGAYITKPWNEYPIPIPQSLGGSGSSASLGQAGQMLFQSGATLGVTPLRSPQQTGVSLLRYQIADQALQWSAARSQTLNDAPIVLASNGNFELVTGSSTTDGVCCYCIRGSDLFLDTTWVNLEGLNIYQASFSQDPLPVAVDSNFAIAGVEVIVTGATPPGSLPANQITVTVSLSTVPNPTDPTQAIVNITSPFVSIETNSVTQAPEALAYTIMVYGTLPSN